MVFPHKFRKIYEDNFLLVLDKPPGLVVDRAETVKGQTVVDYLRSYYDRLEYHRADLPERMGLVHRLDKDTSGILLVAKIQKALENLQSQFKERTIQKEYLALVHGLVEKAGKVEAAIMRNPQRREKFTIASPGDTLEAKEAVTEYEPVKLLVMSSELVEKIFEEFNKIQLRKLRNTNYQLFTLLRCKPQTGRTHQIRVHLKYINHPIVSDEKYVGRKMSRLDRRWCPRMFLHAAKIGFRHPISGKWLELESPLPEDLKKSLVDLQTYE